MTKDIIKAIGRRQILRNHTPVVANITTIFGWEVDLFSVGVGGYTYEFEVKISRADFKRDSKKNKWVHKRKILPENTPNYMSYVCPADLIQLMELPEFAGLYYFKDGEIVEVREPALRHQIKKDINDIQMKVSRMYSQREFLDGITLISHLNRKIRNEYNEMMRVKQENHYKFMQWAKEQRENKKAPLP